MALALDCETTGLNLHTNARPFIVSVCYDDGRHRTWVWEVDPLTRQPAVLPEDVQQIRAILDMAEGWGRDFNEETALNHCVIGHNIKFDYTALSTVGVDNPAWSNTYDTTLMSHLLDSSQHHNLTDLIARYLKVDITPFEDATEAATKECRRLVQQARLAVGRGKVTDTTDMATWKIAGEGDGEGGKDWKADMWLPRAVAKYRWEVKKLPEYDPSGGYKKRHPWWDVTQIYGDVDTAGTVKLFPVLKAAVEKRGHWAIYREVNRQVRATFEMERRGVTCSGKRLHAMIAEYKEKAAEYHKGLGSIAASMGYPLEVGPTGNRTDSLHQFLFGKFGEKEVPVHDKDGHLAGVKVVPDKMTNVPGPDTLNLPVIAKTETGAPAFDKNTMDVYFATLPANSKQSIFVRRLSWLKKLSTAVSYMENYLGYAVPMAGDDDFLLLHPSIKLTATAHLRTGSERPNGQSICFDGDTEMLTPQGWVKASELPDGAVVAQYWKDDGRIDFTPSEVHRPHHTGEMVHITTEQSIDMLLTPNHRCLVRTRRSNQHLDIRADEFKDDQHHYNAGHYVGGDESLSPWEVVWLCAVQADGSYQHTYGEPYGIKFAFKRERKIARLRQCLKELGVEATERKDAKGVTSFYVGKHQPVVAFAKRYMPEKQFGDWILRLNRHTLNLMAEEVWFWDGDYTRKASWTSTEENNANWVQTLFALSGSRATVRRYTPGSDWSRRDMYRVNVTLGKVSSMTTNFSSVRVPWDDTVYCVTVPSSYILIRRNGTISVTGNCKKDWECPTCNGEKPNSLTCPRCKGTGVAIRSFRYAFGPEPGREWYSMDYSNIERRTVAKKAGEEEVMALLENPTAPPYYGSEHLMTAHTIHKKLFEEVCWDATNKVLDGRLFKAKFKDSHYQTTKNMVFALQYSCGREKADATAKVPGAYDMMKARFHRQEAFNQKQLDQARRFGFVVTEPDRTVDPLHGYPIRITPERDGRIKPTKPLAYWSSGTACWIARSALTRCRERLQEWRDADGFDAQIVLFPHDELVFSFPKAGHPNKDRDRSNYTRVMELKEIMQDGGPRLVMNLNSPVNVEYHDVSWDRGDAVRG